MHDKPILINCIRMHQGPSRGLSGNFFHCLELIRALEKTQDLNLIVHVDACTAPYFLPLIPQARLVVEPHPIDTLRQQEQAIARALARVRPALYHKPTGQLPLQPIRSRVVWGVADLGHRHLPMSPAKRFYKWMSYHYSARRANHIIAVSNSTRREVIDALGVSPDHVTAVPHGTTHFDAPPVAVEGCPNEFAITFGHQRHKNVETCIKAIAVAKSAGRMIPLLVIGQVDYRQDLERISADSNVSELIHFPGHVTAGQLRYLYQQATALLFLSRHEGFGLPVLEAMGAGCPVISSNAFSLPEVVGRSAPLFDCDDAEGVAQDLIRLADDADYRRQRISAGYDNAAGFSWERAAAATIAVYRRVLGLDVAPVATP